MNSATPSKVVFQAAPFPRLATGINLATPDEAPDDYRGHNKGAGDPSQIVRVGTGQLPPHLSALLHQIFFQLDTPGTLDPVWDQQTGTLSVAELSRSAFEVAPIRTAEEIWARQVSEMLLLSVYSGPQNLYSGGLTDFSVSAELFLRSSNPVLGLGYRCQDLATFGVASRGIRLPGHQIQAGSIAAHTVTNSTPKGQWFVGTTNPVPEPKAVNGKAQDLMDGPLSMDLTPLIEKVPEYGAPAVHLFSNPKLPPPDPDNYDFIREQLNRRVIHNGKASKQGTVKLFGQVFPARLFLETRNAFVVRDDYLLTTDDGQFVRDNQGSAHIGFLLRIDRDSKKLQFFDTGALNVDGNTSTLMPTKSGFHAANFESPPATRVKSRSSPYKGTGIYPLITASDASNLKSLVERFSKARPLGLARFALLNREKATGLNIGNVKRIVSDGTLIYASPLLLMWSKEEDQNYCISRYLWSLRNMPAASSLIGLWLLYTPHDSFASTLVSADRSQPLSALTGSTDPARTLANATKPLHDIVVDSSGSVNSLSPSGRNYGAKHPIHRLEGRGKRGDILLPLDKSFPDGLDTTTFPAYFRG